MNTDSKSWYHFSHAETIPSPALLVYPERIDENVRRMIALANGPDRLRPHIKTHKLPEVLRMQLAQGITKYKTATIAETELAAQCGAPDVLLAYPAVGPTIARLIELVRRYPGTKFSAVADDAGVMRQLADAFAQAKLVLPVYLDIDCGMHRTGIVPDDRAAALYATLAQLPGLVPAGLHAYDGHIHDTDLAIRQRRCDDAFAPVFYLRQRLVQAGHPVPNLIAGGTPTFPFHARRPGVECSPGTCVLWDAGYRSKLPDMDFLIAALVLTRVVSKPGEQRLCLDLGHKAIAAENPPPRVQFLGLENAKAVTHSEEHLVIETDQANRFNIGDCLYGVPWHICPTVALHQEAVVIQNGEAKGRWSVVGRQRFLSV